LRFLPQFHVAPFDESAIIAYGQVRLIGLNDAGVPSVPGEGHVEWREHMFAVMVQNAGSAVDYFNLPAKRVIELGTGVQV
jgi:K+ transporter